MTKKKRSSAAEFMDPGDAYDLADSLDLPDGATLALAAEFAGMEYGDLCETLVTAPAKRKRRRSSKRRRK